MSNRELVLVYRDGTVITIPDSGEPGLLEDDAALLANEPGLVSISIEPAGKGKRDLHDRSI
jgi:hypothetical protein